MNRRCAVCRHLSGSLAIITGITGAAPVTTMTNTSSVNSNMREQVVDLTGALSMTNYTEQVTRGDSARMLVSVSSYRENPPAVNVSVLADVPNTNPNAVYIRIAASQEWMSEFLSGLFRPDEHIAHKDAVKAFLTMLGYTNEDFTDDLTFSRISKFNYLELNEEVSRQGGEVLSQTNCMNMSYNLLKTIPKDSSSIYGAVLDCELNSDGEINPISILEDERKGPILVGRGSNIVQSIPFDTENANVLLSGATSTLESVELSQKGTGFAVIYYNIKSRATWTYITSAWDQDDSSGNSSYVLLKDETKNIYYKSTDVMTPISVRIEIDEDNSDDNPDTDDSLDSDGCLTAELSSSELQYLLSIYGRLEVDDEAVLVCNEGNGSYTAVDAIEY